MNGTILERIGIVIKYLREKLIAVGEFEKSSTQTRLGMIVGKGRSTISNYENGEINIKLQDIIRIFKAYGYDIVLLALPDVTLENVPKNEKMKKYQEWVTINRKLLDMDEDEIRKILQSFGFDINI